MLPAGHHSHPILTVQEVPAGGWSGVVVPDTDTAAQLFSLAKSSANVADFAAHLQQAGLMAGGSSGSRTKPAASNDGKSRERDDAAADVSGSGNAGADKPKGSAGGAKAQPKLSVPQLSKELAHKHARDGIIIVTW